MKCVEEWRPVLNYEGYYEVSSLGRVRCVTLLTGSRGRCKYKDRNLTLFVTRFGYLSVSLSKNKHQKTFFAHRLVAQSFLVYEEEKDVNHKNGIKTDNRVENLEMLTRGENLIHRHKVLGQNPSMKGQYNKIGLSRVVCQIDPNTGYILNTFPSCREATRHFGWPKRLAANISAVALGIWFSCMGFGWKYEDDIIKAIKG